MNNNIWYFCNMKKENTKDFPLKMFSTKEKYIFFQASFKLNYSLSREFVIHILSKDVVND